MGIVYTPAIVPVGHNNVHSRNQLVRRSIRGMFVIARIAPQTEPNDDRGARVEPRRERVCVALGVEFLALETETIERRR